MKALLSGEVRTFIFKEQLNFLSPSLSRVFDVENNRLQRNRPIARDCNIFEV
jgi:hypothetical protein